MFNWIDAIGPQTWSVLGLSLLIIVAGALLSSSKLLMWVFGAIIMVGAVAALVQVVAFQGARDPILDRPVAYITLLATMVFLGFSLLTNRKTGEKSGGRDWRAGMPKLNPAAVASVAVALLFILGGGSVILNRLDLPAGSANQGLQVAGANASQQSARAMRIIERFLAR